MRLTEFKPLFMLHNALLSFGSGLVLALMVEEVRFSKPNASRRSRMLISLVRLCQIVPIIWKHGIFYSICHTSAWTPRLETYYIINYFVSFRRLMRDSADADTQMLCHTVQVSVCRTCFVICT